MRQRYEKFKTGKGEVPSFHHLVPPSLVEKIKRDYSTSFPSRVDGAILLINGTDDTLVPSSLNQEKEGSHLEYETKLFKAKHTFTKEMVDEAMNFLKSKL